MRYLTAVALSSALSSALCLAMLVSPASAQELNWGAFFEAWGQNLQQRQADDQIRALQQQQQMRDFRQQQDAFALQNSLNPRNPNSPFYRQPVVPQPNLFGGPSQLFGGAHR